MTNAFRRPIGQVRRVWEEEDGLHIDWVPNAAPNGCTWHPDGCDHSARSQWEWSVGYAIEQARERGVKLYVRGFRKSIRHVGAWSYGPYLDCFPELPGRDWSADYGV